MDRKSVFVLVVCGLLFASWAYLTPKLWPPLPPKMRPAGLASTNLIAGSNDVRLSLAAPATNIPPAGSVTNLPNIVTPPPTAPEELVVITNEQARYTFTSHGGGLKQVELLKYRELVSWKDKPGSGTSRFATLNAKAPHPVLALLDAEALHGDGVFKLTAYRPPDSPINNTADFRGLRAEKALPSGLYVAKEFELSSNYLVRASMRMENRSTLPITLPPQQWAVGSATPENTHDNQNFVGLYWHDGKDEKHIDAGYFNNNFLGCFPGTPRAEYHVTNAPVAWASAHNQFFFLALIPNEPGHELRATRANHPLPPRAELAADPLARTNQFAFHVSFATAATNLPPGGVLDRQFHLYAGPKEYRILDRLGHQFKNELDTVMGYGGIFGIFSKTLLLSMNWLNSLGLSYALAIIVITIIIKILFWPLTQASTRAAKKMQALGPQLKELQAKYKEDPAKLQKKTMEFWREHKVNPASGCLPMLVQVPVFIGFFQMVQSAIELRGAQFLWACDLSKPDTVFVIPLLAGIPVNLLPIVMGVTMLWQARIQPMAPGMDPMQAKIMRYMPLIFLVLLYNYSAGLTLYWTVQNILTIAQMKIMNAKDKANAAALAKPVAPTKATALARPAAASPAPKKKK